MYAWIANKNHVEKFLRPQEDPLKMLYFCTNNTLLIGTKVKPYYGVFLWMEKFFMSIFLSIRAYISFNGIKYQKFWREFFHFVIPLHIDFFKNRPKSKVHFCWIFFKKNKCTHVGSINLEWQDSSSKNMVTVVFYFCTIPYETPCIMVS